jgi:ABC-type polysaccharide/polyol phosphate transport system ATPase subunit
MNAIEVSGVTKTYRLYNSPGDRVREVFSLAGKKRHHEFHALRDITLNVGRGETVGIIGQNGSGKSTLLKIITGVVRPTTGIAKVNGRVSSLLELGAGFNPEFTGRDNVYMNGALMGLSYREMERKISEIAAFADIGEFIDQPVRTYSSGMYTRLAFAAAINVDPDILIIDEILSVGDENFQSKCRKKIQDMRESGKTILLVSHDMFMVENLCNRVYLLDHGRSIYEGEPVAVLPAYRRILQGQSVSGGLRVGAEQNAMRVELKVGEGSESSEFRRWGTKDVEITHVYFNNSEGKKILHHTLKTNDRLVVRIEYTTHKRICRPVFGVAIHRDDGIDLVRSNTRWGCVDVPDLEGPGAIEYVVDALPLLPGKYLFSASISDYDIFVPYDLWDRCLSFTVERAESIKQRAGIFCVENRWRVIENGGGKRGADGPTITG